MTPSHANRLRVAPALFQLESRDVPALFYVDPLFTGIANGTVVTFNQGGPGAVAGRVIGTDAFATLNAALTAAAANTESDSIFLARSRDAGGTPNVTPLDNSAGPILINDVVTIIGSGRGATVLAPTTDTADKSTGVFAVAPGKSLSVRDLTLDGTGRQVGVGFRFDGAGVQGSVVNVEVTGINFNPFFGTGIVAAGGASLNVADSQISSYGRIGISFADATGTVSGTTVSGRGAGPTLIGYGLQIAGGSAVTVTGNTITGNAGSAGGAISAGVNLFQVGTAAPTATLTKNTITGNTFGVHVGGNFGVDQSQASIRSNNLNGNYEAIQADNVSTVDAVNNWYGDASGPFVLGANPTGTGSEVTDQVTFAPWLTAPFVNTTTVTQVVTVTAPPQPAVTPPPAGLAVGGSGQLTGLSDTLAQLLGARPFGAGFTGDVRVARADVTGDGIPDYITAAGPGGGPRVLVFDGATGAIVRDFYAFPTQFTGGVFVAAGDVDKDGFADIICGAGGGGGTNVRVFSGKTGELLSSFYVYDPQYIGGVTVAAGDVNGDGYADIVTGTTVGGGPNVRVYDVHNGNVLIRSFFAYDPTFTGGVYVAVGDVNGDGFGDIITGTGPGGAPNVRVFDGQTNALRNSFYAADSGFTGGIRVGAQDLDNDGKADLLFGTGPGGDNRVRVTYGANLAKGNFNPTAFTQPLFGTSDGVYVG